MSEEFIKCIHHWQVLLNETTKELGVKVIDSKDLPLFKNNINMISMNMYDSKIKTC